MFGDYYAVKLGLLRIMYGIRALFELLLPNHVVGMGTLFCARYADRILL